MLGGKLSLRVVLCLAFVLCLALPQLLPRILRLAYSATRIFITPSYHGHNSFNASEILGRGIAQAISITYYPSQTRTPGAIAQKYGYALGRDALTNVFREAWPDIATHVFHRRH